MYPKKQPVVIVFEGIDGAGKSTIIQILSQHLDSIGLRVKVHRTVGSTDFSKFVKEDFLLSPGKHWFMAEAFAMLATHVDAYSHCMVDSNEYDVILMDRWYGSFYAYQLSQTDISSLLRESFKQTIKHYVDNYFYRKPDALFYLDVTPNTSMVRCNKRDDNDFYDSTDVTVLRSRLDQYKCFIKDAVDNKWFKQCFVLDNNPDITKEHIDIFINALTSVLFLASNTDG